MTSYGTSYLFHLLIKKYVFTIYKGIPQTQTETQTETRTETESPSDYSFDHLLFEKLTFWGRRTVESVPLNDLINGASIFNTWRSSKTGEGFLIQFVPPEETSNNLGGNNVASYQGELVDLETMTKLFSEISSKR